VFLLFKLRIANIQSNSTRSCDTVFIFVDILFEKGGNVPVSGRQLATPTMRVDDGAVRTLQIFIKLILKFSVADPEGFTDPTFN
jgi:hypothetical protein